MMQYNQNRLYQNSLHSLTGKGLGTSKRGGGMSLLNNTDTQNALNLDSINLMENKTKSLNDQGDMVYYNVNIFNKDEVEGKQCIFSENRVTPVLQNPSDYKFSCVRFQLPSINIPILFFRDRDLFIKLQYDGAEVQQDLIYIPNSATPDIYGGRQPVYDYQEIVNSLNVAFQTAKTALGLLKPATLVFQRPIMTYDATTQLFSLLAEVAGYDSALPSYIKIFFSSQLFTLFCNLLDFYSDINFTQIIIQNQYNNTFTSPITSTPWYSMTQSQPSLELWPEIQRIEILSNSIPIRQELQGQQDDVQKRILIDFNVAGTPDKGIINFFPQGAIRYYDLISSYPLTQIDCEFRWASASGESFPIFLNVGESCSAKFQFVKLINLRLNGE
jgi:hypothetical protein